jgi:hypothetical protein
MSYGMAIVSNNHTDDSVLAQSTVLPYELQVKLYNELTGGAFNTLLGLLNERSNRSFLRDLEFIYREASKYEFEACLRLPAIIVCSLMPETDSGPPGQIVPHYGYGMDLTPDSLAQTQSLRPQVWTPTHELKRLTLIMVVPPNGAVWHTQHQILEEISGLCNHFHILPNLQLIELYCVTKHAKDTKLANMIFLSDALRLLFSVAPNLQQVRVKVLYREHFYKYYLTRHATWDCVGGAYFVPENPQTIFADRVADCVSYEYMKLRCHVLRMAYRPRFTYVFIMCYLLMFLAAVSTVLGHAALTGSYIKVLKGAGLTLLGFLLYIGGVIFFTCK